MNKIDRQFIEFHTNNPQIMEAIVRYARLLKVAGRSQFGIKAIFERIRWDYAIKTDQAPADRGFKISNNYSSRYARLTMQLHPEFKGFFRVNQMDPTSAYAEEI